MSQRRDFLKKASLLGLSGVFTSLIGNEKLQALDELSSMAEMDNEPFKMPKLNYSYNALEPFIDAQTMEIHYTKHHQGYVKKLNELKPTDVDYKLDDIHKCKKLDPETKGKSVFRNNLGGHVNHCLFWELLKPNANNLDNTPTGKIAELITTKYASFDEFKKQFSEKATKHFGSGWCWLVLRNGHLEIETTENQDNPFMRKDSADKDDVKVALALDVWEHAYYLKYQNKRADYIASWWKIVNWETANNFINKK